MINQMEFPFQSMPDCVTYHFFHTVIQCKTVNGLNPGIMS